MSCSTRSYLLGDDAQQRAQRIALIGVAQAVNDRDEVVEAIGICVHIANLILRGSSGSACRGSPASERRARRAGWLLSGPGRASSASDERIARQRARQARQRFGVASSATLSNLVKLTYETPSTSCTTATASLRKALCPRSRVAKPKASSRAARILGSTASQS